MLLSRLHLDVRPLDYSADNILHGEINRASEITRFPKIALHERERLLIKNSFMH